MIHSISLINPITDLLVRFSELLDFTVSRHICMDHLSLKIGASSDRTSCYPKLIVLKGHKFTRYCGESASNAPPLPRQNNDYYDSYLVYIIYSILVSLNIAKRPLAPRLTLYLLNDMRILQKDCYPTQSWSNRSMLLTCVRAPVGAMQLNSTIYRMASRSQQLTDGSDSP